MIKNIIVAIIVLLGTGMALENSSEKIIFIADPEIIAMPIRENHEPMIDLRHQNIIVFGPSPEIPNNTDYTKMRKTVYEKLVKAQSLLPEGLKFCIYEAYRSLALQKKLFNDRFALLQKDNPTWSKDRVFQETTRLVSPVTNSDGSHNTPPHSTGGAIDIYLIDAAGNIVDMGIKVADWMHDSDGSLSVTDSTKISSEAQKYRQIMCEVLTEVGFVNYKTEYWHWSYGDRYWAYFKQQPYAIYGAK